jgi:hypothetical protein
VTYLRLILLILLILLVVGATATAADKQAMLVLSDSLDQVELDFFRQADVRDLTLERGGVRFILKKGVLTLTEAVHGKIVGASFVGEGRFVLTPPNQVEKFMLAKLCEDSTADWKFKELMLLFTDETATELQNQLEFNLSGRKEGRQRGLLDNLYRYIEKEFKVTFAANLMPDLLQPHLGETFMADFNCSRGHMIFITDSRATEEVQLWKHTRTADGSYPELVCSYHYPDQYVDGPWGPSHEDKDLIDSLEYNIDGKIHQSARIELEAALSFIPRVSGLRSLDFILFDDLIDESIAVFNSAGDSLYWDKIKEEYGITVYFNDPLAQGQRATLTFKYASTEMLEKTSWGNPILVSATTWFPRYGYQTRARFRMRFACPKQYTFLSVGDKVDEYIEDDFLVTEWDMSDHPVVAVSFNYGLFDRDSTTMFDGTPVEVYAGKQHGAFSSGLRHSVLMDMTAAASFYATELAEYPFDRLWATEIPAAHGQGLPGLLHLAWASFEVDRAGYTDAFVAHETAHQWWGHMIGWDTYHDQWLSEGFAEFMAGWYIKWKYEDAGQYRGRFMELLDNWRDDILESGGLDHSGRRTAYQEGNDAGPIWLGYRLASSKSADYFTLVYSKGAYLLYMLRMLMYDFAAQDDSRFVDVLKDFIASHYWRRASTSDFIRIAEKHYGKDLAWFFDQYLYDIQVPYYKWKHQVSKTANDQYVVTLDVATEDVDADFRMLVPVTIVMEGGYHTTTRVLIDQPKQRITLPELPYKPTRVVFNTYKSVLCREQSR